MLHGSEMWLEENEMVVHDVEMAMIRWMCGVKFLCGIETNAESMQLPCCNLTGCF